MYNILMYKNFLKKIVSLEYAVAALFVMAFFVIVGRFDWWWLLVFFLVVDISAIGYVFGNKVGAFTYNLGHSIIGPVLLAITYIMTTNETVLFVTLVWLFHIFIDRALGYGLKHSTSFHHTHLGPIGKAKQK